MKPIKEIPLVLLTVLSQTAIGFSLCATMFLFLYPDDIYLYTPVIPAGALIILIAGLASSLFHLGHPLGGIRSLVNLRFSWLSREILAFGIYGVLLGLDLYLQLNGNGNVIIQTLVCISGIAALYTSSKIYQHAGYPALNNCIPVLSFSGTSVLLGSGLTGIGFLGFFMMSAGVLPVLEAILIWTLIFLAGIHFIVPVFWLSGNQPMKTTGLNHYQSILYWIRGILLIWAAGLFIFTDQSVNISVLILFLIIELIGRVLFFNQMAHSSDFIGKAN